MPLSLLPPRKGHRPFRGGPISVTPSGVADFLMWFGGFDWPRSGQRISPCSVKQTRRGRVCSVGPGELIRQGNLYVRTTHLYLFFSLPSFPRGRNRTFVLTSGHILPHFSGMRNATNKLFSMIFCWEVHKIGLPSIFPFLIFLLAQRLPAIVLCCHLENLLNVS